MRDVIVLQSLQERGVTLDDFQNLLKYEAMEQKPRVLDKAPKRLTFERPAEMVTYGCCSEFIIAYGSIKESAVVEQTYIDLRGNKRLCDKEVFWTLETLIKQGVTGTKERAEACFDLFKLIMTAKGDTLTVQRMYDVIIDYKYPPYYVQELINAIHVCVYNERLPVLYWLHNVENGGFYRHAVKLGIPIIRENCETEKDVEKWCKELYKVAKEDKEFMSQLYKPAVNKYLVAMLYHIKDSHPEALEATNGL